MFWVWIHFFLFRNKSYTYCKLNYCDEILLGIVYFMVNYWACVVLFILSKGLALRVKFTHLFMLFYVMLNTNITLRYFEFNENYDVFKIYSRKPHALCTCPEYIISVCMQITAYRSDTSNTLVFYIGII